MYNTRWHLYFLPVDVNFGTLNDVNFRRWPQADISLVSLFCCSFHLLHPSALCETRPLCPYKHLPEDLRYILVTSYLAKFCRVWIHRLLCVCWSILDLNAHNFIYILYDGNDVQSISFLKHLISFTKKYIFLNKSSM